MEHPEQLLKAISGHHSKEEWDLRNPGCLPLVFYGRSIDDSHIDDDGKKSF